MDIDAMAALILLFVIHIYINIYIFLSMITDSVAERCAVGQSAEPSPFSAYPD
jgi:hypothetical protein